MWTNSVPPGDKISLFAMQDLPPHLQVSSQVSFIPTKLIHSLFGPLKRGLHKNPSFFVAAIVSKLFLFLFLNFLLPKIVAFIA